VPANSSPQVGADFGDYRIDGLLGRGAMGLVYRAWQRRMNRPVALKVLPTDLADDPAYRARFAREIAALTQLDSPHVIQIYDHGTHDGHLYLAMQLVNGADLARVIDEGVLSPRRALRIVSQVATALGDGHAVGVVHRDVKPGNVLLRRRGPHEDPGAEDADFIYLCDFGIARSAADTPSGPQTTGVVGTLGYLAPERLRGEPATPASDVYSLGCLLWALLVGSPPYLGSQPEVIMSHLEAPIPQLDGDDPRTLLVNELFAASMAKDPAQRVTIADFRRRVREILGSGPPSASPPRPSAPPAPSPPAGAATRLPAPAPEARTVPAAQAGSLNRGRSRRSWLLPGAVLATVLLVGGALAVFLLFDAARTGPDRLEQATPIGTTCVPTAVPEPAQQVGAVAQVVCTPGPDVGELRLVALRGAVEDYLREVARQDPAALPTGTCPEGIPATARWESGGHSGTLLCFVFGPNTRYVWTFDDLDVVATLDGRPQVPFPQDLGPVADFFAAARYR
jgi:serine/threonine protein kinase